MARAPVLQRGLLRRRRRGRCKLTPRDVRSICSRRRNFCRPRSLSSDRFAYIHSGSPAVYLPAASITAVNSRSALTAARASTNSLQPLMTDYLHGRLFGHVAREQLLVVPARHWYFLYPACEEWRLSRTELEYRSTAYHMGSSDMHGHRPPGMICIGPRCLPTCTRPSFVASCHNGLRVIRASDDNDNDNGDDDVAFQEVFSGHHHLILIASWLYLRLVCTNFETVLLFKDFDMM